MERLNKNKWSFTKVIGANHRSVSTWKPVVEELKRKLSIWEGDVKIRFGNGLKSNFWRGGWLGSDCLMQVFLRLYALAADQNCSVADAAVLGGICYKRVVSATARNLSSSQDQGFVDFDGGSVKRVHCKIGLLTAAEGCTKCSNNRSTQRQFQTRD
ncbi:hypothetical protein MTR_3g030510 [Medicago truncatula]|uniref:Uncharacterized protein n=1 Tax=Medicago truncatula TaxID=3880 RepID=G7IWR9_MEDTR|nr:hypothetical protein MTR_3g030510 [Medicago truncatula]